MRWNTLPENYPAYYPYEFESLEEVEKYLERARHESIDSLYLKALKLASDDRGTNKSLNLK